MKTSAIDLFCGIGGLSFGLKKAGIKVVAGIDLDSTCKFAYTQNVKGDFLSRDVSDLKGDSLKRKYWHGKEHLRILVGCAPCQPFSSFTNKLKKNTRSGRWRLLNEFVRLIQETNSHIVSMENVPNLANQKIFKEFVRWLELKGFHVQFSNVYCPNYGIPQKRLRLVLLASRLGKISLIPHTHKPKDFCSIKNAIGKLPPVKAGEICPQDPLHRTTKLTPINLQRIRASKPNGTWLDWAEDLRLECHKKDSGNTYKSVYGRMSWGSPSPTITTQFYNYGTGRFGHPKQNRALTIREGSMLQTFPKDYKLLEKDENFSIRRLATHIGNAVPVQLGYVIGKSILKHIRTHHGKKKKSKKPVHV